MSSREGLPDVLLLGVSHKSAPTELREAVVFPPDELRTQLPRLLGGSVVELVVVSTCNRTELYATTPAAAVAARELCERVSRLKGLTLDAAAPTLYLRTGLAAARHLFRVAAGLESLVLGEREILGQVRDAAALARAAGSAGPTLERLFSAAVHVGRRAHAETGIGNGAVSVASAAVALATKVFGELAGRCVLVVGAGDTGRLVAVRFHERAPGSLLIANRTLERAQELAAALGGQALALEELAAALERADVVVCATRAPGFVIDAAMVAQAMRRRPQRPLVLLDIAAPRDVDPAAARVDNVFVHPMDALHTITDQALSRRQREVPRVEALLEQECRAFQEWLEGRQATPLLKELRDHFERVRAEEVGKSLPRFQPSDRELVERVTKALINKLLHLPTTRLKSAGAANGSGSEHAHVVRELFALDEARKEDSGGA